MIGRSYSGRHSSDYGLLCPASCSSFFCSQHVHFAVPLSISKCFQRKSKFQLPYLLDRQTKVQNDKNDSFSLALRVSCKIRDTWLPISTFIKHLSVSCVVLCYSLRVLLATFKIEVRFGLLFFFLRC